MKFFNVTFQKEINKNEKFFSWDIKKTTRNKLEKLFIWKNKFFILQTWLFIYIPIKYSFQMDIDHNTYFGNFSFSFSWISYELLVIIHNFSVRLPQCLYLKVLSNCRIHFSILLVYYQIDSIHGKFCSKLFGIIVFCRLLSQ